MYRQQLVFSLAHVAAPTTLPGYRVLLSNAKLVSLMFSATYSILSKGLLDTSAYSCTWAHTTAPWGKRSSVYGIVGLLTAFQETETMLPSALPAAWS
jgi:hypothetical protein